VYTPFPPLSFILVFLVEGSFIRVFEIIRRRLFFFILPQCFWPACAPPNPPSFLQLLPSFGSKNCAARYLVTTLPFFFRFSFVYVTLHPTKGLYPPYPPAVLLTDGVGFFFCFRYFWYPVQHLFHPSQPSFFAKPGVPPFFSVFLHKPVFHKSFYKWSLLVRRVFFFSTVMLGLASLGGVGCGGCCTPLPSLPPPPGSFRAPNGLTYPRFSFTRCNLPLFCTFFVLPPTPPPLPPRGLIIGF